MNIFELAHKQIMAEIDSGNRPLKAIEVKGQIYPYSYDTLLKYAIKIKAWTDRHVKKGNIQGAVDRALTGNRIYRHNYFLAKGV